MAKPIRATPILKGEDAKRFIKEWNKETKNPSKGRKQFIKDAEKNKEFYLSFI
jgi:hypothetical protein